MQVSRWLSMGALVTAAACATGGTTEDDSESGGISAGGGDATGGSSDSGAGGVAKSTGGASGASGKGLAGAAGKGGTTGGSGGASGGAAAGHAGAGGGGGASGSGGTSSAGAGGGSSVGGTSAGKGGTGGTTASAGNGGASGKSAGTGGTQSTQGGSGGSTGGSPGAGGGTGGPCDPLAPTCSGATPKCSLVGPGFACTAAGTSPDLGACTFTGSGDDCVAGDVCVLTPGECRHFCNPATMDADCPTNQTCALTVTVTNGPIFHACVPKGATCDPGLQNCADPKTSCCPTVAGSQCLTPGTTPNGAACAMANDCQTKHGCIDVGMGAKCYELCNPQGAKCSAGTCTGLSGETWGFCM